MSMNLNFKYNGKEVRLWQTPTKVTSMLMVDHNGEVESFKKLTGRNAKRVMWAYIAWVWHQRYDINLYHYDGKSNKENHDKHIKYYTEEGDAHIKEIRDILKQLGTFEVWQM